MNTTGSGTAGPAVPLAAFPCGQPICPCKQDALAGMRQLPGMDSCVLALNVSLVGGVCANISQCPSGTRLYVVAPGAAPVPCLAPQAGFLASYELYETACEGGRVECASPAVCFVSGCSACSLSVVGCTACLPGLVLTHVAGAPQCLPTCPFGYFNLNGICTGVLIGCLG